MHTTKKREREIIADNPLSEDKMEYRKKIHLRPKEGRRGKRNKVMTNMKKFSSMGDLNPNILVNKL